MKIRMLRFLAGGDKQFKYCKEHAGRSVEK